MNFNVNKYQVNINNKEEYKGKKSLKSYVFKYEMDSWIVG